MSNLKVNELDKEINFFEIIGVLIKNIKSIVIITGSFMIAIVIISILSLLIPPEKSFLPNQYTPSSLVMLNTTQSGNDISSLLSSSGMNSIASLAGFSTGVSGVSDIVLAQKIVKTNSFINKISTDFNLYHIYDLENSKTPKSDLKAILNEKLILAKDQESGLVSIKYTDIDKYLAKNIVNRVTDLLEEEFTIIDSIRNTNQSKIIAEKIAILEADFNKLQNDIIAFQIENNIMDVNIVSNAIVSQIANLQSELLSKEVEIESYGQVSNIKDPAYNRITNERDAILNAISKLENGEVGDYPPVKDLPKLAYELEHLKREAEIKLIAYKALIQQSETLKLTAEGTGPTFQVLEKAEIPEKKSGPSRGKLCMMVSIVGFLFSIIYVFLKEEWIKIKADPNKLKLLRGDF